MTNRRITTTIGLRYEDAAKVGVIVELYVKMLKNHPAIDQRQTLLVYFNQFADSSLYSTALLLYQNHGTGQWLAAQQVLLKIIQIAQLDTARTLPSPAEMLYMDNITPPRGSLIKTSLALCTRVTPVPITSMLAIYIVRLNATSSGLLMG
ncbi:hypothetical protein ACNKHK_11725 [Shigella flexneri]